MAAAVVELDALADAVRPAAEDHDLVARRGIGLALALVGAVEVGGERLELGRAGVDALVGRREVEVEARRAHGVLVDAEDRAELAVADAGPLQRAQHLGGDAAQPAKPGRAHQLDELRELRQEPGVDPGQLVQVFDRPAALQGAEHRPHAPVGRHAQLALQRPLLLLFRQPVVVLPPRLGEEQAARPELERAERLHERFLEGPADRHHFARPTSSAWSGCGRRGGTSRTPSAAP